MIKYFSVGTNIEGLGNLIFLNKDKEPSFDKNESFTVKHFTLNLIFL
jgi:hypothetical protein